MTLRRALLAGFIALQVLDCVSTNRVLAAGGWEANPVEVASQVALGAYWWAPKLIVMCGCAFVMRRWHWVYIAMAVLLMAVVVFNNYMQ
jgi:hypothetical protein